MGERLLCKQEVVGSIPITSTTERAARTMRSIVRREPRQRLRSNRESGRRGRRGRRRTMIDRGKKVCVWGGCPARV